MFDLEKIMSLTDDEIFIIDGLQSVAVEARDHAQLIADAYHCFGIGEDKIEVWSDGNNFEYLTHDGVWQARYLHQNYDVKVDVDTIFDLYKATWLVQHGYLDEFTENTHCLTEDGRKAEIYTYFRVFVNRAEAKAAEAAEK